MSFPVVPNVQPVSLAGMGGQSRNEEDADLSNLLQSHTCLTYEGDVVVDPFVGSGTTAVAAKGLNRRFVGCDEDEASTKKAITRLAQEPTGQEIIYKRKDFAPLMSEYDHG